MFASNHNVVTSHGLRRDEQFFKGFNQKVNIMKLVVKMLLFALVAFVSTGSAVAQTVQSSKATVTVAGGGIALALTETGNGVESTVIKTQRHVMSAFGFAPDNRTFAYSALNDAGLPVAGLFIENTTTGELRKISE